MEPSAALAVLAHRPEEMARLQAAFEGTEVQLVEVQSPEELLTQLCQASYVGVLLSLPAIIPLGEAGKEMIRGLEPILPVGRYRVNPDNGQVGVMSTAVGTGGSLPEFLAACQDRGPKRLRRNERFRTYLNVTLASVLCFEDGEATGTFDLSWDGCFVLTARTYPIGATVYLKVLEANDLVLAAEVKRQVPWGQHFQPQGVGLRFLDPEGPDVTRLLNLAAPGRQARNRGKA